MTKTATLILLWTFYALSAVAAPHPDAVPRLEDEISRYTQDVLQSQYPQAKIAVHVAPLSPVLAKKPCHDYTLKAPERVNPGANSVRVQCANWSFYARTVSEVSVKAVVTKRLIERGKFIADTDLQHTWVTLEHASQAFLTRFEDAIGRIAHRTVPMGRALKARDLRTPYAVIRGDRVVIHAKMGAAHITTTGIAMQNGHIGDQIPVKNERSERVVRPWVTAKGTVSTRPMGS